MRDANPIVVNDLGVLLELLDRSDFWVSWCVKCDISPEWIYGGRSIQFHLGRRPLADTKLHEQLKFALIRTLDIPAIHPDAVISGEGEINRKDNTLRIDFEWSEAVPYMYPRDSGYGTAILVDLSLPFATLAEPKKPENKSNCANRSDESGGI